MARTGSYLRGIGIGHASFASAGSNLQEFSMTPTKTPDLARLARATALPALLLVAGCANTSILSSSNPSRDAPRAWSDYDQLPVRIMGSIPGTSPTALASLFPSAPASTADGGRHIVMYVNASRLPAKPELCSGAAAFRAGAQPGDVASVTGALCDGNREITRASGDVRTTDQSSRWLRRGFDMVRKQLYLSLHPGANDPASYQQG